MKINLYEPGLGKGLHKGHRQNSVFHKWQSWNNTGKLGEEGVIDSHRRRCAGRCGVKLIRAPTTIQSEKTQVENSKAHCSRTKKELSRAN